MTEKQFKVHAEEYQDTDDMGYAIAPPVIYYHVGNSKIGFNFDTEKEAKMLCEEWNKLVKENELIKQENKELKKQLRREETDKKRLMSYLMRYKGFSFDEIVEDFLDEPYYDNWWEDGFYELKSDL